MDTPQSPAGKEEAFAKVVPPSGHAVAKRKPFSGQELRIIREVICKNSLTDGEFDLFMAFCRRKRLDPLTSQVYAVKRWDKKLRKEVMAIQTGIDGFRAIARDDGLAGVDNTVFEGAVEFSGRKVPAKATVTVYRWGPGGREEYTGFAHWASFYPGEKMGHMWRKFPEIMLSKCAEAQALRKGFSQLANVYLPEEMDQAADDESAGSVSQSGPARQQPNVEGPIPGSPQYEEALARARGAWKKYAETFGCANDQAPAEMAKASKSGWGVAELGGKPTHQQILDAIEGLERVMVEADEDNGGCSDAPDPQDAEWSEKAPG